MPNDDKKEMEITRFSNKISQMEETPAKSLLTAGILREFSQLRNSKSMINEALDIYQEILSETEIKDEIFEMASHVFFSSPTSPEPALSPEPPS